MRMLDERNLQAGASLGYTTKVWSDDDSLEGGIDQRDYRQVIVLEFNTFQGLNLLKKRETDGWNDRREATALRVNTRRLSLLGLVLDI